MEPPGTPQTPEVIWDKGDKSPDTCHLTPGTKKSSKTPMAAAIADPLKPLMLLIFRH
jgi:hypothetical protein